jgi:hypothetical protein
MSPISSRRIVPPSASSKIPDFDFFASLNETASYPKSSLSMMFYGIAAQFI